MTFIEWCKVNNRENLIEEYDAQKNKQDINTLSYGSNKKLWWKCKYNHSWEAVVNHRTLKKEDCPYCSNRRLLVGWNDLATRSPKLLQEWNYDKNLNIKPEDFIYSSTKKAWWRCSICGYEWETSIRCRTTQRQTGCPKCALVKRGKKKSKTNLALRGGIKNNILRQEWDYKRNAPLTPDDVTGGCQKTVFWICPKGHSYEARISNRTYKKNGCPYCSGQRLLVGYNDFATLHPELLQEWDYEKNGELKPNSVMSGSRTKVWWKCKNGHSYQATLNHRTGANATGCPECIKGRQTSFAEQAVYYYVKKEFPDAINGYRNIFGTRLELDIYIPSINTAIEYDGIAWHKIDRLYREQLKYKLCHEHGIRLIRLREEWAPLASDIDDYEIARKDLYKPDVLQDVIYQLIKHLTFKSYNQMTIDINIERDRNKIFENMICIKKDSLEEKYPEIAKEWHPTKNGNLKPNMFKPRSDQKVWWLCSKCGYEYESTIGHRTYGTG